MSFLSNTRRRIVRPDLGETGCQIAWAADQAMEWVKTSHGLRGDRILLSAWSLGGEGVWVLTNRPGAREQFSGAILYYPSNQDHLAVASQVPTIMFVGSEDTITPAAQFEEVARRSPNLDLVVLEGAVHGFDIDSLRKPRMFRFPPVIGRKYIFQHNPGADRKAEQLSSEFLRWITERHEEF